MKIWRELILIAVLGSIVMVALPLGFDFYTLTLLTAFAILALSLGFVWGYAGILCFGQAAFYGLGAYAFAITAINTNMPWLAFLAAIVIPAIVAAVLGAMMFYGRLSDVYMAVVTLVFTLILFKYMNTTAGEGYKIGAARLGGFNGIPGFPTLTKPWDPGDFLYNESLYYFAFLLLIILYAIVRLILRSPFGRMLVGIRENELRAELMGYDVRLLKTAAFAIGGAIAGIAGCIFANWAEIVTPTMFSLGQSSEIIIWTIVGGAGTLLGPIIGAGVLGYLKIALGENTWLNNFVILGAILILAVLFLPRGIFPALQSAWTKLGWTRPRRTRRRSRRAA
jgi:ABC-type branched-subunit amino acid transport system permease subunit